ncbi:hypothetical protein ABBQ32_005414 [Trebouxia sp. C0010 RCD-2024]
MLRAPRLVSCRHSVKCSTVTLAKVNTSPDMTRKLKILALHSFRTSGATFSLQMSRAGLDKALQDLVDIVYVNAPNDASGPIPEDVKPYFEGPYFEWWNAEKDEERDRITYRGWDNSKDFIEKVFKEQGPFDGVMGFSQGGACASTVAALQRLGVMLQGAPPLKFAIFFAGALIRDRNLSYIYKEKVTLPSIHIIGDKDYVKEWSEFQLTKWQDPILIRHPRGHVIPRLEGEKLQVVRQFLQTQQMAAQVKHESSKL